MLQVLSILSECESTGDPSADAVWPQLDLVLADATTMFPSLRELHINSFYDTVPILPMSASFSNLSSLILNGTIFLPLGSSRPSSIPRHSWNLYGSSTIFCRTLKP